ncbi:molybdenum cofactor guanylyltransferase [Selenihalanaerobacter shriftii]|uniref:Probable molybdenum cofactor guanylyltransferase n=1 Tax=Selenihalanaerobacter shriftii TaxID=142842 RepID=A0A1T4PMB0_9FIRM|nr:molybdenum cofactor guanylyltransferase [Selenihalanaerobacter shriftii]SJZ92609.1 molybdopterin-guanine dinucleotide biosynthesis protein A [Selenihalanaerobacter shriftii]
MAAIILAGGKSSRMEGANKHLMEFRGETMIGYLIKKLKTVFTEIIISTKDENLYQEYDVQIAVDDFNHQGPLSGIHAGLMASNDHHNLVIGCDMPLLNLKLIEYMLGQQLPDLLVPRINGQFEPLHAIYSKECIIKIEESIKKEQYKIMDFWPTVEVKYIEEAEIKEFDPHLYSFFNVNTRDDYNQVLKVLNRLD